MSLFEESLTFFFYIFLHSLKENEALFVAYVHPPLTLLDSPTINTTSTSQRTTAVRTFFFYSHSRHDHILPLVNTGTVGVDIKRVGDVAGCLDLGSDVKGASVLIPPPCFY